MQSVGIENGRWAQQLIIISCVVYHGGQKNNASRHPNKKSSQNFFAFHLKFHNVFSVMLINRNKTQPVLTPLFIYIPVPGS